MGQLKLIAKKILILLFIIFILDQIVGRVLEKGYFRNNSYDYTHTTYPMEKAKSDLLVLGSSRALHHYNPFMLQDSLKLITFNGGRDGSYIFYHYAMLEAVLKRYHPNVIVLDILPSEFRKNPEGYDRLSILLPYYAKHPELEDVVMLRGKFERVKLLSKIYPYNSKVWSCLGGFLHGSKPEDLKEPENKGFEPLLQEFKGKQEIANENKGSIDPLKVTYFTKFIDRCKSSKIKLIVFISPSYMKYPYKNETRRLAQQICNSKNIPFFDYCNNQMFSDAKLYSDSFHLNNKGATLYTQCIISSLSHFVNRQPATNK